MKKKWAIKFLVSLCVAAGYSFVFSGCPGSTNAGVPGFTEGYRVDNLVPTDLATLQNPIIVDKPSDTTFQIRIGDYRITTLATEFNAWTGKKFTIRNPDILPAGAWVTFKPEQCGTAENFTTLTMHPVFSNVDYPFMLTVQVDDPSFNNPRYFTLRFMFPKT